MQAHPSRPFAFAALGLTLVNGLAAGPAHANVVGVDAQNFNAITSGLDFVTVHSSETLAPCVFNLGLFVNYARNTLPVFTRNQDPGTKRHHRDSVTGGDLNIGVGLMKNWDLGLSMPQILAQKVESDSLRAEFDAKGNTEVRLNTKVRLWGERSYGVAVVGTVSINRLNNNPYAGSGSGPTKTLELAADTTVARVALGINAGYRWRDPGKALPEFPVEPFRDQYIASAAASYHFAALDTKLIAEVFGSRPTKSVDADFDRSQSSAEALLGLKHDLTRNVALHFGGGTEIGHGVASPDLRVYGGVNVSFGPVCCNDAELTKKKPRRAGRPPASETVVIEGVMFAFDSSRDVLPGAKAELKKLADYLLTPPKFKSLVIEGHTDSMGSEEYNHELSERRADTIRRYLIEIHELDASAIKAVGFGESVPVADNGNYQGRQKNRRVEFKIER